MAAAHRRVEHVEVEQVLDQARGARRRSCRLLPPADREAALAGEWVRSRASANCRSKVLRTLRNLGRSRSSFSSSTGPTVWARRCTRRSGRACSTNRSPCVRPCRWRGRPRRADYDVGRAAAPGRRLAERDVRSFFFSVWVVRFLGDLQPELQEALVDRAEGGGLRRDL